MVVWETWSCQRILRADSATIMTGSIWRCMVFWYKIEKYGCCIIQRNALGCRIQRMYGWLLSDIYIFVYIYIYIYRRRVDIWETYFNNVFMYHKLNKTAVLQQQYSKESLHKFSATQWSGI